MHKTQHASPELLLHNFLDDPVKTPAGLQADFVVHGVAECAGTAPHWADFGALEQALEIHLH